MANSPGGKVIGRVSIRVLPDVSDFGPTLASDLQAVEAALTVRIPTKLDTSGLIVEARAVAANVQRAVEAVTVPIDLDAASVITGLAAVNAAVEAAGGTVNVGVRLDRDDLTAALEGLSREVSAFSADPLKTSVPIRTTLAADQDTLGRDLNEVKTLLEAAAGPGVQIPIIFADDRDTAARVLTDDLSAIMDRIRILADGDAIQIPAHIDTSPGAPVFGELAILSRQLSQTDDSGVDLIPLISYTPEVQGQLFDLTQRLNADAGEQPVEIRFETDQSFENRLRQQLRDMTQRARNLPPIEVAADVDIDAFMARLDVLLIEAEGRLRDLHVGTTVDVDSQETLAAAARAVAEVETLIRSVRPTIDIDVDVDKDRSGRLALGDLRKAITDTFVAFDKLLKVTQIADAFQRFATQLALILARTAAYAVLLGPPLLLAASGATAIAPAFATALPLGFALSTVVGTLAIGFAGLFGQKVNGERIGGAFEVIRESAQELQQQIQFLIADGVAPFAKLLQSEAFPTFARGMREIAVVLNQTAKDLTIFLSVPQTVNQIDQLFDASVRSADTFRLSLVPITRALLTIATDSIPGFDRLNDALLNGALRFDRFIQSASQSGTLTRVVSTAVDDLIGFVSGLGRIVGQVIDLLIGIEPIARSAFSGLGNTIEGALRTANDFLRGFQLSGSPLEGFLVGLGDIIGALKDIPADLARAFAPLVESDQFASFLDSVGDLLVVAAQATGVLSEGLSGLLAASLELVGIPLVGFLGGLADALSGLLGFLAQNQSLLTTLAIVLAARYVPAVAAAVTALRTFAAVNVVAAVASTASAIATFVAAIPGYVAGLRAFGIASLGVGAALRSLALSAVVAQTAATAGIGLVIFGAVDALSALNNAGRDAETAIKQITDAYNGLDSAALDKARADINGVRDETVKTAKETNIWLSKYTVLLGPVIAPLQKLAERQLATKRATEAAAEAQELLNQKQANATANINAITAASGASTAAVQQVATALGVDLTNAINESGSERQKVIDELTKVAGAARLGADVISQLAERGNVSFQQLGKAAEDAAKKVSDAFRKDTDVLGTLDLKKAEEEVEKATGKVTKASQKRADAERKLRDVIAAVNADGKVTVSESQRIVAAQRRVAEATTAVSEAQKAVGEARGNTGAEALRKSYAETVALAESFTRNISRAFEAGLDPQVIARLLQAGPAQATPILEAILSDHSGRMVQLVNDSERRLSEINEQVLLQQRILFVAIQSTAAEGTDRLALEVNDAMRIQAELFRTGGRASVDELAKALKLTPEQILQIARDFGMSQILDRLQSQADANPIILRLRNANNIPLNNPTRNKPVVDPGFRDGGRVWGAGTATSDSIMARLSRGEFVHTTASVDYYGEDLMDALNRRLVPRDAIRSVLAGGGATSQIAKATQQVQVAVREVTAAVTEIRAARPRATPSEQYVGVDVAGAGALPAAYPRSLTVVDADGVMRGSMEVAASRDHRARQKAQRRNQLGSQWRED